ncbi:SPFH domain-containing protein [Chitinophagaceae bacterium MMS25-I14]
MSFLDNFKNQLRSVIHWDSPYPELLFYKFTAHGDEIKNLSQLIVGPGQGAILVYEGTVEAIIMEEGKYDIKTDNKPFITTLKKILQRFESEHKTGIWFFRRADMLNCRWGTVSPIKYLDPQYKFPVALSAFGNYSFRITNAAYFFKNIVAGENAYYVNDIRLVLLSRIGQPMTDFLAKAKFSCTDIDAHRNEIATTCREETKSIFTDLGFELIDFRVEGTGFDEDTLTRIGKIADATADNLAAKEVGMSYAEKQQLEALRDAARNEGGVTGMGVQMGAGAQLGQMMTLGANPAGINPAATAASSPPQDELTAKLQKLKTLFDNGLIDEAEYKAKKADLLSQL